MAIPVPYLSQQPIDDFGLPFSKIKFSADLTPGVDTTLTIPGSAPRYKVIFSMVPGTGMIWVALNEVAAPPAGAAFALTTSEPIQTAHTAREVKAGDVIHFHAISFGGPSVPVGVVLYALYTNN